MKDTLRVAAWASVTFPETGPESPHLECLVSTASSKRTWKEQGSVKSTLTNLH